MFDFEISDNSKPDVTGNVLENNVSVCIYTVL